MTIDKPNILSLAWIAGGVLALTSLQGTAQLLGNGDSGESGVPRDMPSPEIAAYPVKAHAAPELVFASGPDASEDFHREDRKLLADYSPDRLEAIYRVPGTRTGADAGKLVESVRRQIEKEPSRLLEIVEAEITANPKHVCEIVKAAVETGETDDRETAAIIRTVAAAAPEHMRLAAQCAIAVNPSALQAVQGTLAALDPGAGDSSATSAKASDAKKAEVLPAEGLFNNRYGDPLDRPPVLTPLPPFPPLTPDPWDVPPVTETESPL